MRTFQGYKSGAGVEARRIQEVQDNRQNVTAKYLHLRAALGASCTEIACDREVNGLGAGATTMRAYHRFIYPPQEGAVMTGSNEDGVVQGRTVREDKTAHYLRADVRGDFGLELDLGSSALYGQPEVRVYDLLGGRSVVPEALASILLPTPEA